MRRVLLTDSLSEVLEDYQRALSDHFQLFFCSDGAQLIDTIDQIKPDLMVLDLSLPRLDYGALEQRLRGKQIPILATALFSNAEVEDYGERIGVRWIYVKPVQSYAVAARLLEFEMLLDNTPDMQLRADVYSRMLGLGATLSSGGFRMLAEGVVYACKHEHCSMTDELYPYVARVCGGTAGSVEIAMRRCIQQAFKRGAPIQWRYYIKMTPPDKCPSNSAFIKQLAFMIRKYMQSGHMF